MEIKPENSLEDWCWSFTTLATWCEEPTHCKRSWYWEISSVQFIHSDVSDHLWPYELQHARLPYPTLSPRVCSNSCLLSWWCYPTISSSGIPFSFCLKSLPASGSFPVSWLFVSGGQSIGASASVLPMIIQGWFPLGNCHYLTLDFITFWLNTFY